VSSVSGADTYVVTKDFEYSNDRFLGDGGKPIACIITLLALMKNATETVNFQLMAFSNTVGMVSAGAGSRKQNNRTPESQVTIRKHWAPRRHR